jgi:hypothetical protein
MERRKKMNEEARKAIHEFLVENWESFCNKSKELGISEDLVNSEVYDCIIDEILLEES